MPKESSWARATRFHVGDSGMTNFEKLVYIMVAIATPAFIAFEYWYFRIRKQNKDAHGK